MKPLFSAVKNAEPYIQKPFRRKEKEKNRNPRTVSVAKVSSLPTKISASTESEKYAEVVRKRAAPAMTVRLFLKRLSSFTLTVSMKTGYNVFRNKAQMQLFSE